jgi:pimeloyl-ACP methyl ester carboxylesterase
VNSAVTRPERLAAPEWFVRAVAQPTLSHFAPFEGVRIHYRYWNEQDVGKPGLLFVHGYRGHSRWWDFIAPFFTEAFRVLAMDLSGMGESDHRERYALTQHSAEIRAVIEHAGLAPATVVGHSYGGSRLLRLCAEDMPGVAHAVVLDSYVNFPAIDQLGQADLVGRRTPYPDRASALARFRLVPDQHAEPYLFHYIARHSLKQVEGGWLWKFDPGLPFGTPEADGPEFLQRITVPVSYVCGEHSSIVSADRAQRIVRHLARGHGPVVIPEAGHHLMMDRPLALVASLRSLLNPRLDVRAPKHRDVRSDAETTP